MQTQFFNYQVLDQSKLNELISNEKCIVIYDKKPNLEASNVCLCDLSTFKISSWKSNFNLEQREVVVFQLKNFSPDVVDSFFRNVYKRVIIFTSDTVFRDKIFGNPTYNTKINLIPNAACYFPVELQSNEAFKALISNSKNQSSDLSGKHITYLYHISACYYDFVHSSIYKFNTLKKLSQALQNSGKLLTVLSNNDFVTDIIPSIPSSRKIINKSMCVCFVFDFDELFDYSGFSECVFFTSQAENANKIPLSDAVTESQFEFCSSLLQKTGILSSDEAIVLNRLFTLANFRTYLSIDEAKRLSLILDKSMCDITPFSFLKLKEVSCGNLLLPFICTRQLLDHVLTSIKNALELSNLFIRCVLPTITFSAGGFMSKEVRAEMSFPGLFEYSFVSDFHIAKKEAVCDVSLKCVLNLIKKGILDENLDVISANLLELDTIKQLFIKAYGTNDENEICNIRNEFISLCSVSEDKAIFERSGQIVILKNDSADMANSLFKRKYMINAFEQEKPGITPEENQTVDGNFHSFFHVDSPTAKLERFYRKIPKSLSTQTNILALYIFSNSKTGVLCAESSKESCYLTNDFKEKVRISYKGTRAYSEDEIRLFKLYQIIFFKLHNEVIPSNEQVFKFFYFAVPLDMNDQIDWTYLEKIHNEFLLDHVCNKTSGDTLIWNPFSHEFYLYADMADKSLEDKINGITFLKFFEQKYRVNLAVKQGKMMFKAHLVDKLSALIRKHLNIVCNSTNISRNRDQNENANESSKASLKPPKADVQYSLCNISIQDPTSMLKHSDFYSKIPLSSPKFLGVDSLVISSAECCFVTSVKTSIIQEIEIFKRNYFLLESLFVAHDLRKEYNLSLDLNEIAICFNQFGENPCENYERLEFIGDCVLKFIATNYFYLSGLSMDVIVSVKDHVVSNQSLFKHCLESGIYKFLKINHFTHKMVQAPHIEGVGDFLKYFNAVPIFRSDNYNHGISKNNSASEQTIKQYADMIEALIGAQYLKGGVASSAEFIYRLNILKPLENFMQARCGSMENESLLDTINSSRISMSKQYTAEDIGEIKSRIQKDIATYYSGSLNFARLERITDKQSLFFNQTFKHFEYAGILPESDIKAIEDIVGYQYTNPGNIERALVHPSFTNTLGSTDFQCLELIGDCSLDLFVTTLLYQNSSLNTPFLLHSSKKSYVNNSSLYDFFHKACLDKHVKCDLKQGVRSKAHSDVVEALIGSILVDLQWNYEKLFEVMNRKIKFMLEECKQELNFD